MIEIIMLYKIKCFMYISLLCCKFLTMSSKLLLSFLILNIYLDQNAANSVKKNYMDMIKTFETLESLDNLKFLNTTLCGIHLTEYASSLKLEQYWALQSEHQFSFYKLHFPLCLLYLLFSV